MAVIKAAPRSFAIIVVIILGGAWVVINWYYSAVLSGRDSQIAVLHDRITAFEQKLQGATPDQAANELKRLGEQLADAKRQLDAVKWPALTESEISNLRLGLRSVPPEDIIVGWGTINCRELADGLVKIFNDTPGWKVNSLHGGGLGITRLNGIRFNPKEIETEALKGVIESATKLKVDIGPDTREQVRGPQSFLTIGTRPF
jgi:hypothetical protein